MMRNATIYHNPSCSKSRQTLNLLQRHGVEPKIIEYLKEPPTRSELARLIRKLGLTATDLVRDKETRFLELRLSLDDDRSDEEWIDIMVKNPILIERPIVVVGRKVALGRPPENVLDIL